MGSILENLFRYLRSRSTIRLIIEMVAMLIVVTWVGAVYMLSTNFDGFKELVNAVSQKTEIVDVVSAGALNKKIDEELRSLMERTGADRLSLSKFHDGKKDVQGMHFLFFSRSNEVLQVGVGSELMRTQNIPVSFFPLFMDKFSKHECVVHTTINPKITPTYQWWKDMGNNAVVRCPIYDASGNLTAFIGMDWVVDTFPRDRHEEIVRMVRDSAARIGGILSVASEGNK